MRAAVSLALLMLGCGAEPVATQSTNNPRVPVAELFTHEGCTVYRFHDKETVYYVTCACGDARTSWSDGHGKHDSSHPHAVETVR
jgi:hypothetical protein